MVSLAQPIDVESKEMGPLTRGPNRPRFGARRVDTQAQEGSARIGELEKEVERLCGVVSSQDRYIRKLEEDIRTLTEGAQTVVPLKEIVPQKKEVAGDPIST